MNIEDKKTGALNAPPSNATVLGKAPKASMAKEIGPKRLILLWGILLLGYFLFVVQWYSIGNFQGISTSSGTITNGTVTNPTLGNGWGAAFYIGKPAPIVSSATNWMITLGRAFGSILAGYLVAKIGHKYAVVTVLGLMVVAFPFIIVAQNQEWNVLSIAGNAPDVTPFEGNANQGTAAAGFALFVIFRTFLAIGGTTLITYTNAVIGRMEQASRSKFITFNQFGFNGGAFFASIFFVFPGFNKTVTEQPAVWTGILSFFIVLSLVLMLTYLFIGVEMVPPKRKQALAAAPNATTFGKVVKQSDTWRMAPLFGIWLVAVVLSTNGSIMKPWVLPEFLPVGFEYTVGQRAAGSIEYYKSQLGGMEPTNVWNMFLCMFVAGFVVAVFTITRFGRTIFERRLLVHVFFGLGYFFLLMAYLCGHYSNAKPVPIAFMMIFGFISGFFLWGVQPILLSIPQQLAKSTPEYVGIVAGLIWGFGYLFYTIGEIILGMLATSAVNKIQSTGSDAMFIVFWVICLAIFFLIPLLPKAGYKKQDGTFVYFDKKWNPFNLSHWNTANKENLIATHLAR